MALEVYFRLKMAYKLNTNQKNEIYRVLDKIGATFKHNLICPFVVTFLFKKVEKETVLKFFCNITITFCEQLRCKSTRFLLKFKVQLIKKATIHICQTLTIFCSLNFTAQKYTKFYRTLKQRHTIKKAASVCVQSKISTIYSQQTPFKTHL